ncbi:hypothetical protein LCGC14_0347440 [marine sediment metagenome]|uniref:Uncharacterized protein n=1 Tax=marine sediment metagenome TaxID=412755 RepID=A0A0F9TUN9_9ZZZZ
MTDNMQRSLEARFIKLQTKCSLPPPVHFHIDDDPELSVSSPIKGQATRQCPGYYSNTSLESLLEVAGDVDFPSYEIASTYRMSIPNKDFKTRMIGVFYRWLKAGSPGNALLKEDEEKP